jgi:hypothetical protein
VTSGPVLRVVSGDATAEEIAAVVAAVTGGRAAAAPPAAAEPSGTTSVWADRRYAHRSVRTSFTPGPDSWRTSFRPR